MLFLYCLDAWSVWESFFTTSFRDIADNKLPFTPEDPTDEEGEEMDASDEENIDDAVKRLAEFRSNIKQNNDGT